MIKSIRHKGLGELFEKGSTRNIRQDLTARFRRRLDALNAASAPGEMNIPGFNFHPLEGKAQHYSVHVNDPWCITFELEDGDAYRVDLENYH